MDECWFRFITGDEGGGDKLLFAINLKPWVNSVSRQLFVSALPR